ncbi:hypothetical protein ABZ611_34530 [Streptomyces sp. NPDC007861]|uniref:hypothetical protein n=1 Tax=Streptomyces sp. NPDC007861 TaxID=3154893 RepID=UPI0034058B90
MSYLISKESLSQAIGSVEQNKGMFVLTSADLQDDAKVVADYFFHDCLGAESLQVSDAHTQGQGVIAGKMTPVGFTDALGATVSFAVDGSGNGTTMTVRLPLEKGAQDMFCGPLRLTLEGLQALGLVKPEMVFQLRPGASGVVLDSYGEVTFSALSSVKFRLRPSQDGLFIEEISAPFNTSLKDLGSLEMSLPGFSGLGVPSEEIGAALKAVFSELGSLTLAEAGVSLSTRLDDSGGFSITPAAAWVRISIAGSGVSIPGGKIEQAGLELIYEPGARAPLHAVLTGKFTILDATLAGTISLPDLTFQAEATVQLPDKLKTYAPDVLKPPTSQVRVRAIGNVKVGQYALVCDLTGSESIQLVDRLTLDSPTLRLSKSPAAATWDASLYGVLALRHNDKTLQLELQAEKRGDNWLFDADLHTDGSLRTVLEGFGVQSVSWLENTQLSRLAVHVDRDQTNKTTKGSVLLQGAADFGALRVGLVVAVTLGGSTSVRATLTIGLATDTVYRTMIFDSVLDGGKFKGTWEADPPLGPRDIAQTISTGALPAELDEVLSLIPFHIQSVTLTVDPAGAKSLVAKTKENSSFAAVLV